MALCMRGRHAAARQRFLPAFFMCCALCLALAPDTARAHRVNIFAFVDGGDIVVECGFSRGKGVLGGEIDVLDAATGQALLRGITNHEGVFRFPIPAAARQKGHDLRIRINAGEGHQNEWTVAAAEFAGAPPASPAANPAPKTPAPSGPSEVTTPAGAAAPSETSVPVGTAGPSASAGAAPPSAASAPSGANTAASPSNAAAPAPAPAPALTPADVERIVNAALDAKLAPIKRTLAERAEEGPGIREIIGGIGWIFGLVGVAAYFRRRPH